MTASQQTSASAGVEGLPELIGRLAVILRGLEQTCSQFQDGLGVALSSGASLSSDAREQLQQIDRVTQTIHALADLFGELDANSSQNQLDIADAISKVRLHSLREQLDAASLGLPHSTDVEIF